MEPIISPWAIYFMGIADTAKIVCGVVGGITGVATIISFIVAAFERYYSGKEKGTEASRMGRRFLIFALIFVPLSILIPDRTTVMGMIIAQNITAQNIEKAAEAGKIVKDELKRDILEIIDAIQNEEVKGE